jgi:hypothetical protein
MTAKILEFPLHRARGGLRTKPEVLALGPKIPYLDVHAHEISEPLSPTSFMTDCGEAPDLGTLMCDYTLAQIAEMISEALTTGVSKNQKVAWDQHKHLHLVDHQGAKPEKEDK